MMLDPSAGDLYEMQDLLDDEEWKIVGRAREFLKAEMAPVAMTAGRGQKARQSAVGVSRAGDGSRRSVDGDVLPMGSVAHCGSDEQRRRWLPDLGRMGKICAFALTEPTGGVRRGPGVAYDRAAWWPGAGVERRQTVDRQSSAEPQRLAMSRRTGHGPDGPAWCRFAPRPWVRTTSTRGTPDMKIADRIRAFLSTPKGQRLTQQAREQLNKPENKRRLGDLIRRLRNRR